MAAAIEEGVGKIRRPELLNKIDIEVSVNDAILLATDDGVLTALDDRYIYIFIPSYRNHFCLEHYVFGSDDKQENIGHLFVIH